MAEVPSEFIARIARLRCRDRHRRRSALSRVAVASLAVIIVSPRLLEARAGPDRRRCFWRDRCGGPVRPAGRDHRYAVRRHSVRRCQTCRCREFRVDLILPLLPAALTVAILAAVESLLSAVVADR